jgi:tetratricopeptide (TPR) repeat protein
MGRFVSSLLAPALMLVAAAGGLYAQQSAREQHARAKETSEVYLLPPPEQLTIASLGHRSALADLLWANVLVTQGLRMGERRRFETVTPYLEAIVELDPKWRDPYRMADALVTLQAKAASLEELRATRRLLERGVKERPYDAELWLVLGQYVGYVVPNSYLETMPEERDEWRRQGAEYLKRAAELSGNDSSIAWNSIGGARIFAQTGQLDRAIEMYQRVLATTDDPELREDVTRKLRSLAGARKETERDVQLLQSDARLEAFRRMKPRRLPGLTPTGARAAGFPRDPALCAGGAAADAALEPECSPSWREWAERAPYGGLDPSTL